MVWNHSENLRRRAEISELSHSTVTSTSHSEAHNDIAILVAIRHYGKYTIHLQLRSISRSFVCANMTRTVANPFPNLIDDQAQPADTTQPRVFLAISLQSSNIDLGQISERTGNVVSALISIRYGTWKQLQPFFPFILREQSHSYFSIARSKVSTP